MSGHSKWHNIQKTKGAADAKRSAAYGEMNGFAEEMFTGQRTILAYAQEDRRLRRPQQ